MSDHSATTMHFPYTRTDREDDYPGSVIVLSDDAAQKLSGRFVSNSGWDPNPDRPKSDEIEHVRNGAISVDQVQILDNGWVRAVTNIDRTYESVERVDLLFPPQEIRAIYTRSVVNSGLLRDAGEDRQARIKWRRTQLKLAFDGRQEEGATG